MKKRLAITSLTCLQLLISCLREEYSSDNALQRKEWFRYTDPLLAPIAETMRRIEDDKPFMDVFCKTYGIPLWDYADIYQETGDDAVHFWIPLYHNDYPNEIRTIWYFKMEDDLLDYAPITRDAEFIKQYGQDFQFDYVSYRVFGPKNAAGMEFRDRVETRSEYGSYEVIGYECKDAYVIIELDGMTSTTYKGTICKEIKVWVDYMDENISSLPDGSGGGGGGGGSGSDVPVGGQGEAGTEAKKIFENKNMTDNNWETLDKMIEKIKENCMGEALYNGLVEAMRSEEKKIHIEFILGRASGFSAYEKTISIGMDYIQSNGLLHEMFHALQYYTKGKDAFNKSTLNCEIEAHYAQYLYLKSLPEFKGSYWEDMYKYDPRLKAIADLEKYLDKSSSATDTQILNKHLSITIDAFRESEGYSDTLIYKYDPNQGGISVFSLLQNLTKNCNR